jgi:hypothetical protein
MFAMWQWVSEVVLVSSSMLGMSVIVAMREGPELPW